MQTILRFIFLRCLLPLWPCSIRHCKQQSFVNFWEILRPTCTNFRYLLNHFVAQKLQNCLEFTRLSSIKYFFVSVWGVVRSWFVRHYKDKNFNDHSNFFPQIFPLRDEKVQKFLPNSCIKISPPKTGGRVVIFHNPNFVSTSITPLSLRHQPGEPTQTVHLNFVSESLVRTFEI